jgi:hypothetical protein
LDLRRRNLQGVGEDSIMRRFTEYYSGDEVKEDKMGGACNTHGINEKCINVWSENVKGRGHSEDLGVDGKIITDRILWK